MLLLLHKPYGVLSQFTPETPGQRTLAEFCLPPGVYPIGRLDMDSEGMLLLSDEKPLVDRLLHPRHGHPRTYAALVERVPDEAALSKLQRGVPLDGRPTLPCRAWKPDPQPEFPPRDPPVRFRKSVQDCWIFLELTEGRNRQVRRMCAAVGHPVLRLIRVKTGALELGDFPAGQWRELSAGERRLALLAR